MVKGLGGTVPLPPFDVVGLIPCGYINGVMGKPGGKGIPAPNAAGFKPGKFGGIWGFELLVVAVEEVDVSFVFPFVVGSEFSLLSVFCLSVFSLPFCLFSAY